MRTLTLSTIALMMLASTATMVHANGPMGGSMGASNTSTGTTSKSSGQPTGARGNGSGPKGGPMSQGAAWVRPVPGRPIPVARPVPVRYPVPVSVGPGAIYHGVRTVINPAYPVYQVVGRTLVNITLPVYSVGADPNYQRQAADAYGHMSGKGEVGGTTLRQAMDD